MEKEDLAREKRRLGEGKGKIRRGKREDKVRWGIG